MTIKEATLKSVKSLRNYLPWMIGIILFISLVVKIIPESFYTTLFSYNLFLNSFFGSLVGSIAAGNPITSYIIGGELLDQGVGLISVTAFLVAWVTVGVVQFPAEATILGKKFAILRNVSSFIFAIIVAIITVSIIGLIS